MIPHKRVILVVFLLTTLHAAAQVSETVPETSTLSIESIEQIAVEHRSQAETDTTLYPALTADTTALDSIPQKRPGLIRRIINYYSGSNIDRTFVKKFDWSIAPGPNYSSDIGFGIGVLVAGLYRIDRTDSVTMPSNATFYGNITTKKFVLARFAGDNFFRQNKYRLSYSGAVVYFPGAFYGVGYEAGQSGYVQSLDNTMYKLRAAGSIRILRNTYAGVSASFDYTGAKSKQDYPDRTTFENMRPAYEAGQLTGDGKKLFEAYQSGHLIPELTTPFDNYIHGVEGNSELGIPSVEGTHENPNAFNTSIGLFAQYDTRDVITSPHKGILFKVEFKYYPKALGNSLNSFGKINLQFDAYQKLWPGMILAYDLFSEFSLGRSSWHMYSRLGGTDRMRGYYEGRYRDDNMVETQLELRQKIYRRHGVVGWFGVGNIWGNDAFRWKNTLYSFGFGYRFEFKNRMNIRLDYGWGVFGNPNLFWDNKRSSAFIFTASEAF